MKGKIVNEVPPWNRQKGDYIDWDAPAKLAQLTGHPILAASHIPNSRVKSVRQYTRPPFVTAEGRIVVEMRNSKVDPADGIRYGDVYMRWIPTTTTEENK